LQNISSKSIYMIVFLYTLLTQGTTPIGMTLQHAVYKLKMTSKIAPPFCCLHCTYTDFGKI